MRIFGRFEKSSLKGGLIALLLTGVSGTAAIAQHSSAPHGTSGTGGTCTFNQQVGDPTIGSKAQIKTGLQALITTLNTGTTYASADGRDLVNGSLANLTINGTGATNKALALKWVKQAFISLDASNNAYFHTKPPLDPNNNDPNGSEFAMLGLSVMMASGKLTVADINADTASDGITDAALLNNIGSVLTELVVHTAGSNPADTKDYTNMYLMNTTSRILMDQALHTAGYGSGYGSGHLLNGFDPDNDLLPAEQQMVTYLNEIKTVGIHEFDSPIYSGTQLESLVEGFRYAQDANTKLNYTTALDYLWLDLATDWHNASLRIAPPFSRNYHFMEADGLTRVWIEAIGCWTTGDAYSSPTTGSEVMSGVVLEHAELYDILNSSHGYQLPWTTYQLATLQGTSAANNRTSYQYWGADKYGQLPVKVTNLGSNVTFGCTPGHYGPQDTLVGGSLKGDLTNAPNTLLQSFISSVLDSSGSPYGTIKYPDGEHSKTEHLQANVACALTGNVALVTFNIDGTSRSDAPADNGLSTNILFPVNVTNLGDSAYPQTAINGAAISTLGCPSVASQSGTIQYCALKLVADAPPITSDVVTFKGMNNNGVIGVKFVESGWTDTMNLSPQSAYQLEIDKQGSLANPNGDSNGAGRIVVTHTNKPYQAGTGVPTQFMVSFLVATDDSASATYTNVYNILHYATFTDKQGVGDQSKQVLKVVFDPRYYPTDSLGNAVHGLQVIRSKATLTDIGLPSKDLGSGFVSSLPALGSSDMLYTIDGAYHSVSQSGVFWTPPAHPICTPGAQTCP